MSTAPTKLNLPPVWDLILQVPPAWDDRAVLCLDAKPAAESSSSMRLPVNLYFLTRFVAEPAIYKVLCDCVADFTKATNPLKMSLTKAAAHRLRCGLFEGAVTGTPKQTLDLAKDMMLADFKWRSQMQRREALEGLAEAMTSDLRRFGELDKAMETALAARLLALKAELMQQAEPEKPERSLVGRLLGRQKTMEPEAAPPIDPFTAFKRQFWRGVLQVLEQRQATGVYPPGTVTVMTGRKEYELIREPLIGAFREFAGEAAIALPAA